MPIMPIITETKPNTLPTGGYNNYFVHEKDLPLLPPYLRDVPETREEVRCDTEGHWPEWLDGSFLRLGILARCLVNRVWHDFH